MARGRRRRQVARLGARAQCRVAGRAASAARLCRDAPRTARGAECTRPHPVDLAPRRLCLQPLAGRGAPARPVAAHHAGRIRQARAGVGNPARRRRTRPRREGKLGLPRRELPWAGLQALPAEPVARRLGCRGGARVRRRDQALRRRRLLRARSQVRRRLGGCEHDLRGQRFWCRLADGFGLPAGGQALVARHAAGRGEDDLRSREERCLGLRVGRSHAGVRAHHRRPLDRFLYQPLLPAEKGRAARGDREAARCQRQLRSRVADARIAQRPRGRQDDLSPGLAARGACRGLSARRTALRAAVRADGDALARGQHPHPLAPAAEHPRQRRQPGRGAALGRQGLATPQRGHAVAGCARHFEPVRPGGRARRPGRPAGRQVPAQLHRLPDARFTAARQRRQRRACA